MPAPLGIYQPPAVVEAERPAMERYANALETTAVATLIGVMGSSRASASERLQAADMALRAVGKRDPVVQQQAGPALTINLLGPVRDAFRGLGDVAAVMARPVEEEDGIR